jgi:hypothetical protein
VNTKVLHTRFYADEVWTQESLNETTEQLRQSVTGAGIFSDGSPFAAGSLRRTEDTTDRLTVGIVAKKEKPLFDNSCIMHGRRTVEDDQRLILTRFGKTTF